MDIQKRLQEKKDTHYKVKGNSVAVGVKDVDVSKRIVTGFFNTYNYLDSDGDVLVMGSAKKSIFERGVESNATAKIKHALFHDLNRLPGKIQVLKEDTINGVSGIYFETKMSNTTEGNDTLQNYLEGVYDNHSIGFRYIQLESVNRKSEDWNKWMDILVNANEAKDMEDIFIAKEISLFEGSTVAFGANTLTPFLGVKSGNKESMELAINTRIDKLGKVLKSGKQSDDAMYSIELQLLQIKQLYKELAEQIPTKKDTRVVEPSTPVVSDTAMVGLNYNYLLKNIKI